MLQRGELVSLLVLTREALMIAIILTNISDMRVRSTRKSEQKIQLSLAPFGSTVGTVHEFGTISHKRASFGGSRD